MAKEDSQTKTVVPTGNGAVPAASPLDRARARQLARDYRGMDFAQARAAATKDGMFVNAADAGIGFMRLEHAEDKEHLVGVELMVLPGWQVNNSTKIPGAYFTSCYVKTAVPVPQLQGKTEFIVNDGSSGIARQLADLREFYEGQGLPDQAVYCAHGFKKSEYEITDDLVDNDGNVVIDKVTRRPVQTPRLDPVTQKPVGKGVTYYLDETP